MTTSTEMVAHVKRLDRLYLSAQDAIDAWKRYPDRALWRRYRYFVSQYNRAVAEGVERFGLDRQGRKP